MKRLSLAILIWLLLAGMGVTALFVSVSNRLATTFGTDARILHRVISQRMEQQEAVLNAVDALERQGVDRAALGTYVRTLLRPYPQVVAVERCTPLECQVLGSPTEKPPRLPASRAAAPAVGWPDDGGPLYALSRGSVRVWVDARRLTEALDSGAAPLSYTLFRPQTAAVIVAHTTPDDRVSASTTLQVEKILGTALQPFPIRISRPVPWESWPWLGGVLWTLLTAGLSVLVWRLLEARRAAQRALLDERARASGVVEAASEAIVALDEGHQVTLANPAARAALSHPLPPGTDLQAVTTFQATLSQAPFDAAAFWESLQPTSLPEGLTLLRPSAAGQEAVQVEGSLSPLRGADGELRGRVLILREVGPLQRRMLEHLEHGERRVREHEEMLAHVSRLSTLGEMGAGLAHELNQPLTAIISYGQAAARLLDDPEPDLERVRHAVGASVAQARRAAQIITRLRQWVRRAPSQSRPTDLAQAALNVLTLCRADLNRLGVQVVTSYADAPLVRADPVQLEQIILNLLRNALDAVQGIPDPTIRLSIAQDQQSWTLSIRDNGSGIAADVSARLFTPFTTSKAGGLGLGLSLSQTLAQGMGGDLSGANANGGGAVFTLSLPRLVLEAASD
ncbi:ATP-binding protein (plasmid) [Deinococcus sp. KNUC1210]|uniref:sensor histidine kinase n=1 Tax=Deinococcus sp. KNUC1210 TaxID=2917691 RepID=UPI001EF0BF26|nr:ATP-binding protein [Deinococcus sp. KNUC1210]ULH18329.1 ATP-binding protein [Deinococcus sp. KNUC1210]